MIRIASAAWPIDRHADRASYAAKLEAWVAEAAAHDARLLVFPEYGNMELAFAPRSALALDAAAQVQPLAAMAGDIAQLHADLARRHKVHILAGSTVERDERDRIVNRARLFGPEGGAAFRTSWS